MGFVYFQRYETEKGTLIAACDEALIGRTFRQGKMRLMLDARFYGKNTVTVEEAVTMLEPAEMMNLAGHEIVQAAVDRGLVHPAAIIRIAGIPHVQVLKM